VEGSKNPPTEAGGYGSYSGFAGVGASITILGRKCTGAIGQALFGKPASAANYEPSLLMYVNA
jgi:hypothetical protein